MGGGREIQSLEIGKAQIVKDCACESPYDVLKQGIKKHSLFAPANRE